MDIVYSLIFGAIQGLTEFLPVSSSGHLVILHSIFDFTLESELGFDVFLHLGSLVALIVFFFKDIIRYIKAFFQSLVKWDLKNQVDQKLAWFIIIGTVPAAIAGFFLDSLIEEHLRSTLLVAIMLIVVAVLFFIVEKYSVKLKEMTSLKWYQSLLIGVAQAIALIPGTSRSGITIITGMTFGLKRGQAARFSFLLSIPIVFGAGLKKFIDLVLDGFINSEILLYLLGFLAAAVVGYFCIKYFLKFLQKYSLAAFGWYRIGLAVLLFILIIIFKI